MKLSHAILLAAFWALCIFAPGSAGAAGNPGRSAMECVTATRDQDNVVFHNRCSFKIFVVWCGELKYSKRRCGDGPAGNSFYTHSSNVAPGGSIRAYGARAYRYAACEGGIGFGKEPIQDQPDGGFTCLPSRKH